jgi:hypothetical protein
MMMMMTTTIIIIIIIIIGLYTNTVSSAGFVNVITYIVGIWMEAVQAVTISLSQQWFSALLQPQLCF